MSRQHTSLDNGALNSIGALNAIRIGEYGFLRRTGNSVNIWLAGSLLPRAPRRGIAVIFAAVAILIGPAVAVRGDVPDGPEQQQATAVALNYCRAAFHRIRQTPSKRVLLEERSGILNNIDLNGIADEKVVRLYSLVLDEIGQIEIADQEQLVIKDQTRQRLNRKLGTELFVLGTDIATGQVTSAVRTGANGWWDYRDTVTQRDVDLWKVERNAMTAVISRSSEFLDAFWKLSRQNNIPDRWLIRDMELTELAGAVAETDPEIRLRVLRRLEKFMECYPPYWYYLGRTQQQLGQLTEAVETYRKLERLGTGHFRRDEMLATGIANLAVILDHARDADSVTAATRALDHCGDNWEVNLICGTILARHRQFTDAEDALLRNLDTDLEESQSSLALVSLYFHSNNRARLAKCLANEDTLRVTPIPGLLLCAGLLGQDEFPATAARHLARSLHASRSSRHGQNQIAIRGSFDWKLADARITLESSDERFQSAAPAISGGDSVVRFVVENDDRTESDRCHRPDTLMLTVQYPSTPAIHVRLTPRPVRRSNDSGLLSTIARSPDTIFGRHDARSDVYVIEEVEIAGERVSLVDAVSQSAS